MKILQVTFNLTPGGAERFVVDLSNELVKENEVVLLTLMDDKVEQEKRLFYLFDLDKRVEYKNLGIQRGGGFRLKVLWKVFKAMERENADVIHLHVHSIVNFSIVGIVLLCWRTTIVQTIHTDFKVGHSSAIYKFLFRTIGRMHKMRWAALSETNYKEMVSAYPFLLCRRIDNGRAPMVPSFLFDDVRREVEGYKETINSRVFLHVARCVPLKNQTMLVAAFNRFREMGNDAVLLIIGADFETALGQGIQKMAGKGIYILGTRKNIADYMLNADCFCLSSDYEGLPITVLEAILSGVPVVSTPVKGVLDVIKDGETGVISNDFSEQSYIDALGKAMTSLDILQKNASVAKENSPYTIAACANNYLDFYKE